MAKACLHLLPLVNLFHAFNFINFSVNIKTKNSIFTSVMVNESLCLVLHTFYVSFSGILGHIINLNILLFFLKSTRCFHSFGNCINNNYLDLTNLIGLHACCQSKYIPLFLRNLGVLLIRCNVSSNSVSGTLCRLCNIMMYHLHTSMPSSCVHTFGLFVDFLEHSLCFSQVIVILHFFANSLFFIDIPSWETDFCLFLFLVI